MGITFEQLTLQELEGIKKIAPVLVEMFEDGACMFITDLEKVLFKQASRKFDVPGTDVGVANQKGGVAEQIIKAKRFIEVKVAGERYGVVETGFRISVFGCPIVDGEQVVGAWVIAYPVRHPLVKTFKAISDLIDNLSKGRIAFYLTDLHKIVDGSSTLKTKYVNVGAIQVGAELTPQGVAAQAIAEKRVVSKNMQREVFGIACELAAYPLVLENGEVVGAMCAAMDRTINEEVKEHVLALHENIQQIAAAVQEVAASVGEVVEQQSRLSGQVGTVRQASEEIEEILAFIQEIANETKMLGLNAAIEAARAGEAGRGFGVVAEEIRKLSEQSKQTVGKIRNSVRQIQERIEIATNEAEQTVRTAEQQAAATQQVNASIEEITVLVEKLAERAQEL